MIVSIPQAIEFLNQGRVVAIPTETVYGLAARIDRSEGIDQIFSVKERPFFDPLIVHVADPNQAQSLCQDWSPVAEALAKRFWPGPLTLVVEKAAFVSDRITSGLSTVGIRCPQHEVAREIIKSTGPLAAPSANKFGKTSPTKAGDVEQEFFGSLAVVDGGSSLVGVESTILVIDDAKKELHILRPGMILTSHIEDFLRQSGFSEFALQSRSQINQKQAIAPGNMKHHYMPAKPLVIIHAEVESEMKDQEILLRARSEFQKLPESEEGVRLHRPKSWRSFSEMTLAADPRIAARELYSLLRKHSEGPEDILLLRWQREWDSEAWAPIRDRLMKAASVHIL